MTKSELRSQYRIARSAITREQVVQWSKSIAESFMNHPAAARSEIIFAYESMGNEVQTAELIEHLKEVGKVVLAPGKDSRADPACDFKVLTPPKDAYQGSTACSPDTIARIDLFIVPGIVWDLNGYRIGFGGGYFDRLLAHARPDSIKLGLAFELQIVNSCPHDPWDIPVNDIITEKRNIVVSR